MKDSSDQQENLGLAGKIIKQFSSPSLPSILCK